MRRRDFISLISVAVATWPLGARAQRTRSIPKVGVLMAVSESGPENQMRIAAFRQGFAELGWKDGQNVQIEYRWAAGKIELIQQYSKELVALAPDVILAHSTPVVEELKKINRSIPIVCALFNDPVGLGFVRSLSHPGGNITGFTYINPELIGKWIGLLRDVTPGFTQAAVMYNPNTTAFYRNFLREIDATRQPGANEVTGVLVETAGEIQTAINSLAERPGSGLIIGPDPFTNAHLKQIAQFARQKRLPAISVHQQFAIEGGLMAYGPDTPDVFRRSAAYVDRILKGANPADLPVQEPTKFEFVINLKTAQAFGLSVSPALLSIANQVIE